MALEDPLHQIDTFNLETEKPVIPWQLRDEDGYIIRNEHERALGDRDAALLTLVQAVKTHGMANVSPLYPFAEDATLKPSQADCYDLTGTVMADFTVDPAPLAISTSFIADLKLILSNEFREPFLSKITLKRAVDPNTSLVQIFIDLEISARYTLDQQTYPIITLTNKAYNDVQDNTAPSSKDHLALSMEVLQVANRDWLNSGVVRFNFLGSVQSTLATSWSVGTYLNAMVEGFSTLPTLGSIVFTFPRTAASLTELSYNLLGDLQNAIPFLDKIKYYPFAIDATAGQILAKYITDAEITGLANKPVFLKRIHKVGSDYKFLFAYNDRDLAGNYLGTVNVGIGTLTSTGPTKIAITSLGSNRVAGIDPTWLDEVPTTGTTDNLGLGSLTVVSYAAIGDLFAELLAAPIELGSPSPIDVSPVVPVQIVGLYADPDLIEMVEDNSHLDNMTVDIQGTLISTYEHTPLGAQQTRNVQITIGNVIVNRRTCYGQEGIMRDFYGIASTESLVNNPKIPLEDEWFDSTSNTVKRYQIVSGQRKWRTL
jgi:hypothetical protein